MRRPSGNPARSVIVVGAGGNIGSHLVPHLARMTSIAQVTLIDRDVYEPANLSSQCITPRDVRRTKVSVQARILRRINPQLLVTAIRTDVENLPLGRLRADVILACLDSRKARQWVNQAAWRLGVPWIDAGVEGGGLLARINVYLPDKNNPCLECAWDERDYSALEQAYPCSGAREQSFSTHAPSSLGALAASLQAIECEKLLSGGIGPAAVGEQVLIDATHHKHYVTSFRRNPNCRVSDHSIWAIKKLGHQAGQLTVIEALELGRRALPEEENPLSIWVEGQRFVRRLTCFGCGRTRPLLRLQSSFKATSRRCAVCRQHLVAAGSDLLERLDVRVLSEAELGSTLGSIGLRSGEVITVGNRFTKAHFEIPGSAADLGS